MPKEYTERTANYYNEITEQYLNTTTAVVLPDRIFIVARKHE